MPQPSTIASNFRFLMYSFNSAAHSSGRISTVTPSSRSCACTISAIFLRSSLPWLVSTSNENGRPSFTSRPSLLRVQPASASRRRALSMPYGYVFTLSV